ncbi:phage tail protein, partial [uncultured Gilliamella sp.]
RIDPIADKFHCDLYESRIYSEDKRFCLLIRNDGLAAGYNVNENKVMWYFQKDGALNAKISVSNIFDLENFIGDKTIPVGIPQPWPSNNLPSGWLECNGSAFDKNQFPKLAAAYSQGFLPDLRGEFIRGWDNFRGVDPERELLSWETDAIRNIYGEFKTAANPEYASGVFNTIPANTRHIRSSLDPNNATIVFNASSVVPVAHENRPRNIAFMYIVKAE